MKKIIFMGTPKFSATVLEGILASRDYDVVAVVTQPDRKVGRKRQLTQTPVKQVAVANNLPCFQPEKLTTSEDLQILMDLGADGIITAAYGQFLPERFLKSVGFALNVHASLLPKYRGGAPIHYALINGDEQTGVTIMEMVKEMDAGDMVAQASLSILETDTVGTLFDKLAVLGRDLLLECLPDYLSGQLTPIAQDPEQVSFSPTISPQEERLEWQRPARMLYNQIRGMNPYPVAYTLLNGERFKIYESEVLPGQGLPGQIIEKTKKQLLVATGEGILALKRVQPAGKPAMSIQDFLNGLGQHLKVGDRFD